MARTRRRVVEGNGEDNKASGGNCKDNDVGISDDVQDNEAVENSIKLN